MSKRRVPTGRERPSVPPSRKAEASGRGVLVGDAVPRTTPRSVTRPVPMTTQEAMLEPRTAPVRPKGKKARSRERSQDEPPRKAQPVIRFLNGLMTMLVLVGLGAVAGGYYLNGTVEQAGPLSEAKVVSIPRNDGRQQIAERLEREGIVSDRRSFVAGLYMMQVVSLVTGGKPINLRAGDYEMKPGASIRNVIDTLSEGRSVLMKITVPEGLTSHQIVERLKAEQLLTGDLKQVPPEGTLMPETYSVQRGTTREQMIELMQAGQKKLLEQVWSERQQGLPFDTPEEALALASIIEKETGRNDERERVAAVFVNRLRQKIPLQSDPTILYGMMLGKVQWGKPIMKSEIRAPTAYNTYTIPALPPGPICNPGRAAIEAAVKPAQTNELFFVADGKGGHIFAATNREHEANVAKWRQIEKQIQADRAAEAEAAAAAKAAPKTSGAPIQPTTINAGNSDKAGAAEKKPRATKQ